MISTITTKYNAFKNQQHDAISIDLKIVLIGFPLSIKSISCFFLTNFHVYKAL